MNPFGTFFIKLSISSALALTLFSCVSVDGEDTSSTNVRLAGGQLQSLADLSVDALRRRTYGTGTLDIIASLDRPCTSRERSGERPARASRYIANYESEGHSIYARIDIPFAGQPENGYPVMIFAHGWVGADNAPNWHFGCTTESSYGDIYGNVINAWAEAGYVVLVPGYRGHGTVNGIPADGHEDMLAWDNGAYLMPSFYAVDVMNLMASSQSSKGILVPREDGDLRKVEIDASRIYMNGHSQGGDVTLTVLAAVGEGADSGLELAGASIWAGNIADRFTQLATFEAVSTSSEAFLSGDGTWNGTAIGADGAMNPNFVFGFPPDWIGSPHPVDWTWQKETFSHTRVQDALRAKTDDMYDTLQAQVTDLTELTWKIDSDETGRVSVKHDPGVRSMMSRIGGANVPEYLSEPLNLHFSDRDFYSLPAWNEELCADIRAQEGHCQTFEYFGNTHSLGMSEHAWFSPPGTVAGHSVFIERDLCTFGRGEEKPEHDEDCQGGDIR